MSENISNKNKIKTDICPECIKQLDRTQKIVSECKLCHRFFCEIHLKPKLVHIHSLKDSSKIYKTTKEIIERHNNFDGGHPCFQSTKIFWKKYDNNQKRIEKEIIDKINKSLSKKKTLPEYELEPEPKFQLKSKTKNSYLIKFIKFVIFLILLILGLCSWYWFFGK